MKLHTLREQVCRANGELKESGLVQYSFGNVSGVDRDAGVLVIKPSGVDYSSLTPELMVTVSLTDGAVLDAGAKPSVDTEIHRRLYLSFPACGGIVHTHSECATACAQAGIALICRGTTHADVFYGDIALTRMPTEQEVAGEYEANTGALIVEAFAGRDPAAVPAVLVAGHGPFAWGPSAHQAVHNAVMLEFIARMELHARALGVPLAPLPRHLLDKHYLRKHGSAAYYGQ